MKRLACTICLSSVLLFSANFASASDFAGLPDSSKTPGTFNSAVTQSTIKKTICVSGWTATIRPNSAFTSALKTSQLRNGYAVNSDLNPSDYEEDHLIPLEIGGSPTSLLNLWPELWAGSRGAHAKDRLENKIKSLICKGAITLSTGRAIFADDWTAGYEKWIGPLPALATASSSPTPTPSQSESSVATPSPSATIVSPSPSPTASVSSSPVPIETPSASTTPSATSAPTLPVVSPGAFCSVAGAQGANKTGVGYTCKTSATDSRLRWRQ